MDFARRSYRPARFTDKRPTPADKRWESWESEICQQADLPLNFERLAATEAVLGCSLPTETSGCPYFVRPANKKAPSVTAKCLIQLVFLVGSTSFELVTPAV